MSADFQRAINTTLSLYSEEKINLIYVVEIEEYKKKYRCFESENYNQALLVANKVFDRLKVRQDLIGDFSVIIESPLKRGISYDINQFTHNPNFADSEDFYKDLVNEFEHQKIVQKLDNNSLFRQFVDKNKLNEYQERKFLYHLKDLLK